MTENNNHNFINYYDVLGVKDINEPISEIRKKYIRLATKYHPDKNTDSDSQIFELIQKAWDYISDENNRIYYNSILNNKKDTQTKTFTDLKNNYNQYIETCRKDLTPQEKENIHQEFLKSFKEMDAKYELDNKRYVNSKNLSDRAEDLMYEREQQELEFSQSRLPINSVFTRQDLENFNKLFKTYHSNDIIEKPDAPLAWNLSDNNYTELNNFDNLFNNNVNDSKYNNIDNFGKDINLEFEDEEDFMYELSKIPNDDNDIKISTNIDDILKEYDEEGRELSKLGINQFDNDNNMYMFTPEVVDSDAEYMLEYDNDEKILKAYDKLLSLRDDEGNTE